jgi:hypothetical protein
LRCNARCENLGRSGLATYAISALDCLSGMRLLGVALATLLGRCRSDIPDLSRPDHGRNFKARDAERFRIGGSA